MGEGSFELDPRAAKLRAAERTDAPPSTDSCAELLPRLPSLADVLKGARR